MVVKTYKKLFGYAKEKMYLVFLSIIFALISTFLNVLPLWLLGVFLKEILILRDVNKAFDYSIFILMAMLGYVIFNFAALWTSHLLAFRLESVFRQIGCKHLLAASFSFFDANSSGKIRQLIDDNAAGTHKLVAHLLPDLTSAISLPVFLCTLNFYEDWALGVFISVLIGAGYFQIRGMMGNESFMSHYMQVQETMNSEAVEYVRGMQVIKIFGAELKAFKNFNAAINEYADYARGHSRISKLPYSSFQVLFNICCVFTIPWAMILTKNSVQPGIIAIKLVIFSCSTGMLFSYFMKIMYVGMYHFKAKLVVEKMENLVMSMNQGKVEYGELGEIENFGIEFHEVDFSYDGKKVLEKFSVKFEEGKTYALVGASGAGKSTIAKLAAGFYKAENGEILIGGNPIFSYTEQAVCENITFVFQQAHVFKKSIYDNVAMGNREATYGEVMKALQLARCESIINKFPDRENTVVGTKGVHLSGGEKQKIAIARAILKNAKIIILDEASSATDVENEREIQKAFSNLTRGKTVITIAHRLCSIKEVDEILVLDKGKVIGRGAHSDLMEICKKYRDLQNMYDKANAWRIC